MAYLAWLPKELIESFTITPNSYLLLASALLISLLTMAPRVPRVHLFEINDQPWLPAFIRARVQACLTLLWTFHFPVLQPTSPAGLVTKTLHTVLGARVSNYTYVDFCSGAGGPTPYFEEDLNARLRRESALNFSSTSSSSASQHSPAEKKLDGGEDEVAAAAATTGKQPELVDFVMTDIAPHVPAWKLAAQKSAHLHFVAEPVDASNAPPDLLDTLNLPAGRGIFRLFSLAFHHFPDPLARSILANTLETSAGFAILELQERSLASFVLITLMAPLLFVITPFYFWRDPVHLVFTYLIPVIPFVVVFDGYISSLRTRTGEEVKGMAEGLEEGDLIGDWELRWGHEWHTRPVGKMTWVIGIKKGAGITAAATS